MKGIFEYIKACNYLEREYPKNEEGSYPKERVHAMLTPEYLDKKSKAIKELVVYGAILTLVSSSFVYYKFSKSELKQSQDVNYQTIDTKIKEK